VLEVSTKQGRWANKAGGPKGLAGQQGWLANKAGWPTRRAGQQGWLANKVGWLTRQVGLQDKLANKAVGPIITTAIFKCQYFLSGCFEN